MLDEDRNNTTPHPPRRDGRDLAPLGTPRKDQMRLPHHAWLPPGELQGWRACAHTPSRAAPPMGRHQLHPQGSSTYSLTQVFIRLDLPRG